MVSKIDLGLLDAYKLMYFDRNINGNKDGKILRAINESCVTLGEFHFSRRQALCEAYCVCMNLVLARRKGLRLLEKLLEIPVDAIS